MNFICVRVPYLHAHVVVEQKLALYSRWTVRWALPCSIGVAAAAGSEKGQWIQCPDCQHALLHCAAVQHTLPCAE